VSELLREAVKDGQRVALIRCYDGAGSTVVELEADQTGARRFYHFVTAQEAFRFVQEAALALQYLGCQVSEAQAPHAVNGAPPQPAWHEPGSYHPRDDW
jgi:hypothetical protein